MEEGRPARTLEGVVEHKQRTHANASFGQVRRQPAAGESTIRASGRPQPWAEGARDAARAALMLRQPLLPERHTYSKFEY
jgi:hypothetical protein